MSGGSSLRRVLVLTGDYRFRKGYQHRIVIDGNDVWLPLGRFRALCILATGRLTKRSGYVCDRDHLYPQMISCLRKDLSEAMLGRVIGEEWIEPGGGGEYRLMLEAEQLARDTTLPDLKGVISADLMQVLLELPIIDMRF